MRLYPVKSFDFEVSYQATERELENIADEFYWDLYNSLGKGESEMDKIFIEIKEVGSVVIEYDAIVKADGEYEVGLILSGDTERDIYENITGWTSDLEYWTGGHYPEDNADNVIEEITRYFTDMVDHAGVH